MKSILKFLTMMTNTPVTKPDTEYISVKKRVEYLNCKSIDINYFKVVLLLLPFSDFSNFKKNVKESSLYLRVNDKSKFERTLLGNTQYTVTLYDLFLSNCVLCERLEEFKEICLEFLILLDKRYNSNEPIFYNENRLFTSIVNIIAVLEQSEYFYVSE